MWGQEVRFRPPLHQEGPRHAQGGAPHRGPPRTLESLSHLHTGSNASFGRRSSASREAETSSPSKRRRLDRERSVGVQYGTVRGQAPAEDLSAGSPGTTPGVPTESASTLKRKREEQEEEAETCPICESLDHVSSVFG